MTADLDGLIERLNKDAVTHKQQGWDGDAEWDLLLSATITRLREENARLELWGKAAFEAGFQERQRAERAEAEVARAYQMLAVYGVTQERARSVGNGIEVLMQRANKGQHAMQARIAALEAERDALLGKPMCGHRGFAGHTCCVLTRHHSGEHKYGDPEQITIARVIQERDALKADAERYRWLRDFVPHRLIFTIVADAFSGDTILFENDLDAAIDAAREQEKK
jgi:hypothetical protein